VDELAHRDDVCLFALDETGIRLESASFYGWAPKGQRLHVEANGDHKGVNVISATEILRQYRPLYSAHPFGEGMKAKQVGRFIDKLMRLSDGKEVWVIWDNYQPHRAIAAEYENKYRGRLHFMFLPPYSPELNPQENMWAWLKDYCARTGAYSTVKDLRQRIRKFYVYAYNTPSKVRRRVNARTYFKAA
jgi:transposase